MLNVESDRSSDGRIKKRHKMARKRDPETWMISVTSVSS